MTNATDTSKTLGESMFAQCGYAQDAIDRRVSQVWYEIFEGPNKFYWENDEGLAYVMDTGTYRGYELCDDDRPAIRP